MSEFYEIVKTNKGFPIKTFIHSVNRFEMHWHKELEILLVLEGSINITIGNESYILEENDLIVVNTMEMHSINKTKGDNILLALQINLNYYSEFYPKISEIIFECNSILVKEKEKLDVVRGYLAEIIWETSKNKADNELILGSQVNLLTNYIVNNFAYPSLKNKGGKNRDDDIKRMEEIILYIHDNIDKKITLKNIAEKYDLNSYYLSHFFKDKTGISFQEYINTIRSEMALGLLINTDNTITDIVFKCGFSSTSFFNKIFREKFDSTPTEYREKNIIYKDEDSHNIRVKSYLDVDRKSAFKKLFTYLPRKSEAIEYKEPMDTVEKHIEIDIDKELGINHKFYWKKLTTLGRAKEGLRTSVQNQLREMQRELSFEYIRFHGIFSDDMMIYHEDRDGSPFYNWTYVDELFDFFMSVNIKPFIELGFMPSELKRSNETIFQWKANISPPKDIKLWKDLVESFVKHCINRYGLKEVETWYFEVWNEPELTNVFWVGTKEEYFEFFKETSNSLKSISKNLKVGGPSITYGFILNSSWLDDFLIYCKKEDLQLDFVSAHIYPEYINQEKLIEVYSRNPDGKISIEERESVKEIYHNHDHSLNINQQIMKKIEDTMDYKPEIHITEWNASSSHGNLIHDTAYVSAFIIKNILESIETVDSLGYWTFTDLMEEEKLKASHFHGGFGLINKDGIRKASYYAYSLLSKLGPKIIDQGEDYVITKDMDSLQILAFNYVYFDQLFLKGDNSALTENSRYEIYEEKSSKELKFIIKGLFGYYKISRYTLNRQQGSAFDRWIDIGAPENMDRYEIDYLKGISRPKILVKEMEIKGEYREKLNLPIHGIELLTISRLL